MAWRLGELLRVVEGRGGGDAGGEHARWSGQPMPILAAVSAW
jgi:hypothetical protein